MGNETPHDEAFRQFQKDVAALARMSGQEAEDCSDYEPSFRAQEAARESPSESENEDIEPSPVDSCDAAVPCIPLTVNPESVATHSVRAGGAANAYRAEGYDKMKIAGNWHHDDPEQDNSGKTV